jgi:hypothetical protein
VIIRVCLAVALLVMPITATAQGNPGPFGQLFGRAPASTGQEQTLVEVRSDLSGMYDTMLMAPEGERLGSTQSGALRAPLPGLIVEHTSEKFDANLAEVVAREQHFRDPEPFGANRFQRDASVKARLSDRWEARRRCRLCPLADVPILWQLWPDERRLRSIRRYCRSRRMQSNRWRTNPSTLRQLFWATLPTVRRSPRRLVAANAISRAARE